MAMFKVKASGVWVGGEIWNFGMHVQGEQSTAAVADAWQVAMTNAWSGSGTPAGALNTLYAANVELTQLSAAEISLTTGKQQTRADRDVTLPGVSTEEPLPPQNAIVVSLRTPLANRGGRGRFYLPAPAVNAVAAGRVDPAAQGTIVNAIQRMFTSLTNATLTPVIWGKGQTTPRLVISFNVGDVFDTQRRRRNQLSEVRQGGTV